MAGIEDLLNQLPLDQIAGQLGMDPDQLKSAAESGLGALVQGMEANAQDPAGAASLEGALNQHTEADVSSLDAIDTTDGEKIVKNIFGDNTDSVMSALGGTGGGQDMFSKLLPILAPIVMAFIARKMAGAGGLFGGGSAAPEGADATSGGGGLGDVLGGMLGGGSGGGGLADILGGMLGGGRR